MNSVQVFCNLPVSRGAARFTVLFVTRGDLAEMSMRKDVVEKYIDGFRRGDHEQILSCLTDDVRWEIYGHATIRGKSEFEGAIESDATPGLPTLTIDRLIEEGDSVVAVGGGNVALAVGGRLTFVFSDVFTFTGDAISRLESYQVNLSGSIDA